jgi:hypothetical protein
MEDERKMRVCLIQLDGKMPNLALMKLASWHRKKGDNVTVLDLSGFKFDRTYASKIFVGGSGYDLKSELPSEIEAQVPDYELFKANYSIGFSSRGCIRDCGFCIVKEKEGSIRESPFDWISNHKVILLDNNFLASPRWKEKLQYFIRQKLQVCFTQGLDIRLINEENAKLLAQVDYRDNHFREKRLYFSFDDPKLESVVKEKVAILNKAGILSERLLFYILVGYDTSINQDLHRVNVIRQLGSYPFIMVYNNRKTKQLRDLARWVNQRIFRWVPDFKNYNSKIRTQKLCRLDEEIKP